MAYVNNLRALFAFPPFKAHSEEWALVSVSRFSEHRSFRIEIMLPGNARLAEFEHVFVFKIVHFFNYVMGNLGLNLPRHVAENSHLDDWQESCLFKNVAVISYGRKGPVELEQAVIRPKLSVSMRVSQDASSTGVLVRGTSLLTQWRVSLSTYIRETRGRAIKKFTEPAFLLGLTEVA